MGVQTLVVFTMVIRGFFFQESLAHALSCC